eukprot:scaffold54479_cov59-Attheya_sp.AAC.3
MGAYLMTANMQGKSNRQRCIIVRLCSCADVVDEDYHKEDILKHLDQNRKNIENLSYFLGDKHEFIDGTTEVVNEENILTKLIPDQYLSLRKICMELIKEGLTLGGDYNLPGIFRPMPLEAVQKLTFSRPVVTAQGIIDILVPK